MPSVSTLKYKQLHPGFVAEVEGVDWSKPLSPQVFEELREAIAKYGVLVFRNTGITDEQHVEFSRGFGKLDTMPPVKKSRFADLPELMDLSNLKLNNELAKKGDVEHLFYKSNELWHADMAYTPQRTKFSILRGYQLPPKELGGHTQFLDTRSAYEGLSPEMKNKVDNLIANTSFLYNRRIAAPELYNNEDPYDYPVARYRVVYPHDDSGRKNLYLTMYTYHFDGMTPEESAVLIKDIFKLIDQEKYVATVEWDQPGDIVMWDNTAVLHRATQGEYEGLYRRDMRRTSVLDRGPYGIGENDPNNLWKPRLPEDPYAKAIKE